MRKNAYGDTNEEIVAAVNKQTLPEKDANDDDGEENEEKEETVEVQEKEETVSEIA